ncbi:MAG TPA: hypothetical protein VFZ34_33615, partial [Blastocatellia bacterium]|nr:hypothetical protein [Blastocatellia bacterium]
CNANHVANLRKQHASAKAERKNQVEEMLLPIHRALVYQPCQAEATTGWKALFRLRLMPRC